MVWCGWWAGSRPVRIRRVMMLLWVGRRVWRRTARSPRSASMAYSQLAVSSDGRRIFFQAPAGFGGALYLREDGARTQLIWPNGQFWAASADGSRAFFSTTDSLVAADTDGGNPDLYMYDRNAPAGAPYTLISQGATRAIPGIWRQSSAASPDGHYVYFVSDQQLIASEPAIGIMGLYVWHDGQLRFIGTFPDIGVADANGPLGSPGFSASARRSRITPDGRYLLFGTTNDDGFVGRGGFAGYDHAGHRVLSL